MLETLASIHFAIRDIVVGNAEVIRALEHLVTLSTKRPSGKLILPCRLVFLSDPRMLWTSDGQCGSLHQVGWAYSTLPSFAKKRSKTIMFMTQTNFALLHHVIGVN